MIIGIDPGQKGGVAGVDAAGNPAFAIPMPILNKVVQVTDLVLTLQAYDPQRVIIEQQSIMGGQRGAMSIGANFGRIMAAVEHVGLPHRVVTPLTWNRAVGIPKGLKGRAKKEAAFAACRRLWGERFDRMDIKISHDGKYEALLIAYYGAQ